MQRIVLNDDIRSLSEFRAHTSGFINQVHKTKRPLVITQNGKSAAVLLDVAEYERIVEKFELVEDVRTAKDQIVSGKGIPHARAHEMLKARYSK